MSSVEEKDNLKAGHPPAGFTFISSYTVYIN